MSKAGWYLQKTLQYDHKIDELQGGDWVLIACEYVQPLLLYFSRASFFASPSCLFHLFVIYTCIIEFVGVGSSDDLESTCLPKIKSLTINKE